MNVRILVTLLVASCGLGSACKRNGSAKQPAGDDSSVRVVAETPTPPAVAETQTLVEAVNSPDRSTPATGEPSPSSSDSVDEPSETPPGEAEPSANGTTNTGSPDSSQDADQPEIVIYNRTQGDGLPWMTMPAYKDKDGRLIKHGLVSEVSESGALRQETNWTHGKKDGFYRTWYENGVLAQQGEFSMNTQIGTWTWWHNNGRKEREGTFNESNQRDGLWTYWDRQGALLRDETWIEGVQQLPVDP